MAENWKKRFTRDTLDQGRTSWEEGRVRNLRREGETIRAVVEDGEPREVEISLENREPAALRCGCPEGSSGGFCFHQAAALYALEQAPELLEAPEETDWRARVRELPRDLLEDVLLEAAEEDPALRGRLLELLKGPKEGEADPWEAEIRDLVLQFHPNVDGCAALLEESLRQLMDREVPALLKAGRRYDAFRMVCRVFERGMEQSRRRVAAVRNRDARRDWDMERLTEDCRANWRSLVEGADRETQGKMFVWFLRVRQEYRTVVQDILFSPVWDPRHLRWALDVMAAWIRSEGGDPAPELMTARLKILEALGTEWEEMVRDTEPYQDSCVIRQWKIRSLRETGQWEEAAELLRRSREMDRGDLSFCRSYTLQLADIARGQGQREREREELWKLVFEYQNAEVALAARLKSVTPPDDWPATVENILRLPGWAEKRLDLLEQEGMYDRLYAELDSGEDLAAVARYAPALERWSHDRTLELYKKSLNRVMYRAGTRKGYAMAADGLRDLCILPGGRELAGEIAGGWRTTFSSRRALLEELRRVGF